MAETSTIFGFMKYVSATDILSDFKKTVDSHFVNSLIWTRSCPYLYAFINSLSIDSSLTEKMDAILEILNPLSTIV